MAFPGSLTLRESTFTALMEDYVDCYVRHGFETIIILPTHGGNFTAVQKFTDNARGKYANVNIICGLNYEAMIKVGVDTEKEDGVPIKVGGSHSGGSETSLMLHHYPNLVNMNAAEEGFVGDFAAVREKMFAEGMYGVSKNGVIGDARAASPEQGKKVSARMVAAAADIVRKALA